MPVQVKISFNKRAFMIAICGVVLGMMAGAAGAAELISGWTKRDASHNVGEFEHLHIWSACTRMGPASATSDLVELEIPAIPQQDQLLGDWIVIPHPGWGCAREFRFGALC